MHFLYHMYFTYYIILDEGVCDTDYDFTKSITAA